MLKVDADHDLEKADSKVCQREREITEAATQHHVQYGCTNNRDIRLRNLKIYMLWYITIGATKVDLQCWFVL